jgi:hypothetical protein
MATGSTPERANLFERSECPPYFRGAAGWGTKTGHPDWAGRLRHLPEAAGTARGHQNDGFGWFPQVD